jgi:hypothetical protein
VSVAIIIVAGPSRAQSGNELKKRDRPFGVLALNEPQEQYLAVFERYQLGSAAALLRVMAQSSKCFLVVGRGAAMQDVQQEELATLKKSDDLVFLGQEKEGYLKVHGSSAEGRVKKSLVTKR